MKVFKKRSNTSTKPVFFLSKFCTSGITTMASIPRQISLALATHFCIEPNVKTKKKLEEIWQIIYKKNFRS
jgi:hypothetical protein